MFNTKTGTEIHEKIEGVSNNLITVDTWLDNSKRKTFSTCERKFYYEYIRNLSFKTLSTPMFYGNMVHAILEAYYKRVKITGSFYLEPKDFEEIYEIASIQIEKEKGNREFIPDYRNFENAKRQFEEYYLIYANLDSEQMEVLETERSLFMPFNVEETIVDSFKIISKEAFIVCVKNKRFSIGDKLAFRVGDSSELYMSEVIEIVFESGEIVFKLPENMSLKKILYKPFYAVTGTFYGGKIDLICNINGVTCCLDHKTTAQSLEKATKNQHWSPQFMGYQELCRYNGYDVSETVANFLQLSAYFSKKTNAYNPPKFDFLRTTESYNKGDIQSWWDMVDQHYKRYLECVRTNTFVKERDACYQFGKCCSKDSLCNQNKPLGKESLNIDWIEHKWEI